LPSLMLLLLSLLRLMFPAKLDLLLLGIQESCGTWQPAAAVSICEAHSAMTRHE
jgi:hypothetical protein